jgi:integrase
MPLTDTAIRKAKPAEKPRRLYDGGGLYLEISPAGGKLWRQKYTIGGKEKRLALGSYPAVTLAQARQRRDDARRLLADGVDPGEHRKAVKAAAAAREADSFEVLGREWFAKRAPAWAPSHADKVILRLENDVFPWIGGRPVGEITAQELLSVANRITDRGAVETAHRAMQYCAAVFRYAIVTGRASRNPAVDLRGALPVARKVHRAAITDPAKLGELLRAIDGYTGSLVTKSALRLAPLVFVRPGELRRAEWSEIDLDHVDGPVWNIPAEKMKMGDPHLVPLASQAVAILRELQPLTGGGQYVFPGGHSPRRPMSENAVLAALRRMGYAKDEMSGHGFRAAARTILDEVLHFRPDYIEHQLAHAVKDPNGRAYNRTSHLPERRKMMQAWADYLDALRDDTGTVVAFRRTGTG